MLPFCIQTKLYMTKDTYEKAEYDRIQAIRTWNAKFRTPPVLTAGWREEDWERWRESRKPLPSFEEWMKQQEITNTTNN